MAERYYLKKERGLGTAGGLLSAVCPCLASSDNKLPLLLRMLPVGREETLRVSFADDDLPAPFLNSSKSPSDVLKSLSYSECWGSVQLQ